MYKPVDSKVNFPAMEEKILEFWEDKKYLRNQSNRERVTKNLFSMTVLLLQPAYLILAILFRVQLKI